MWLIKGSGKYMCENWQVWITRSGTNFFYALVSNFCFFAFAFLLWPVRLRFLSLSSSFEGPLISRSMIFTEELVRFGFKFYYYRVDCSASGVPRSSGFGRTNRNGTLDRIWPAPWCCHTRALYPCQTLPIYRLGNDLPPPCSSFGCQRRTCTECEVGFRGICNLQPSAKEPFSCGSSSRSALLPWWWSRSAVRDLGSLHNDPRISSKVWVPSTAPNQRAQIFTYRMIFGDFSETFPIDLCGNALDIAPSILFAALDERVEVSLRPICES